MPTTCRLILSVMLAAAGGQERADSAMAKAQAVLTAEHFWRKHYTYIPPRVSEAAAKSAGLATDPASRAKALAKRCRSDWATPAPAAGWMKPGFDDSSWSQSRGRQFVSASGGYSQMKYLPHSRTNAHLRCTAPFTPEVGLICMRGYFRVSDPAKVRKLTLSLAYRGGVVAYLNGREVARRHLPKGALAADTPGEEYPLAALFADGQKTLTPLNWWNHRESKQWLLRERASGAVDIAPSLLTEGLNVVALELHRSDWPAEAMKRHRNPYIPGLHWSPVGLGELELSAEGPPGAVESLVPRRSGLQVWNADIARAVGRAECANWDARLRPMRIVAARNGRFSGQVVVTQDREIAGLAASATGLKRVGGGGAIGPEAIRVRYGAVNPTQMGVGLDYLSAVVPSDANFGKRYHDPASAMHGRFDLLLDAPPAAVASVPVWVTVRVPKAAPAGDYAGELTIRVDGAEPVKTPIELRVADWTLPDVADRVSLLNIYQSPDTLATYYKVKPWSPEHWALVEKSLKLMGENGNIALIIPMLAESQMGNVESMVTWLRQKDGTYKYDFSVFDRYVATARKHHPRLKYLFLIVWGIEMRKPNKAPYCGLVTVVEPDGKRGLLEVPAYGTEACEELWRPVLTALRDRLKPTGLDKKLLLGMPADCSPPPAHLQMFRRILPEAGWMHESHMRIWNFRIGKDRKDVIPVTYQSMVYTAVIPDPRVKRHYGWRHAAGAIVVGFNRPGYNPLALTDFPAPGAYRHWIEINLVSDRAGAGRVGGDYWHINAKYKGGKLTSWAGGGMRGTLFGSYAHSQVGQVGLANNTTDLFGPGPRGPVSTVRFENACEGIHEAEARVLIEKALLDKAKPLPAKLAAQCQEMLDERSHALRGLGGAMSRRRMFDLAGQVQRAVSGAARAAPPKQ